MTSTAVLRPSSRGLSAVVALLVSLLLFTPSLAPVAGHLHQATTRVIVQLFPGDDGSAAVRAEVARLGGTVERQLPIVHGFSVRLPRRGADLLSRHPAVRAVTPDAPVQLQAKGDGWGNSGSAVPTAVKADKAWASGVAGRGVTVAVVDTGIADVPDLRGRVRNVRDDLTGAVDRCVNLSGEDDCGDSYGHGTFIAGLIAGPRTGVAPEADLVSVKVAGRDGSADVSGVLAAIQWAVSFKDEYGIRVLNLSLGTDSTQSYRVDPFNYAVERAWDAGIVVVVAASNLGPGRRTITKPGDDPWVITVGAVDDRGTPGVGDDTLPDFSARGPTAADGLAKPDVVAPGGSVLSLRAPGSAVDLAFPPTGDGPYRRGSGTSMATGVVSGVASLVLSANPGMAPNRLKYALLATARPVASKDRLAVGRGEVDAYAAAWTAPAGVANIGLDRSTGLGSLDASRGGVRVQTTDPMLTVVNGLLTAQLLLWDPLLYTTGVWSMPAWYASSWYGSKWYGSKWYGSKWYGSKWYGSKWYGEETPASDSYGTPLEGGAWLGAWL